MLYIKVKLQRLFFVKKAIMHKQNVLKINII